MGRSPKDLPLIKFRSPNALSFSLRIAGCRGWSSADFVCVPLACVQLLYLCLCFRPLAFQAFLPPCVATVRMNIPHTHETVNSILHFFWIFLRFFCFEGIFLFAGRIRLRMAPSASRQPAWRQLFSGGVAGWMGFADTGAGSEDSSSIQSHIRD